MQVAPLPSVQLFRVEEGSIRVRRRGSGPDDGRSKGNHSKAGADPRGTTGAMELLPGVKEQMLPYPKEIPGPSPVTSYPEETPGSSVMPTGYNTHHIGTIIALGASKQSQIKTLGSRDPF